MSSLNLHSFTALRNGDPACVKDSPFSLWNSKASREAGKCFWHIEATIGFIFMYLESHSYSQPHILFYFLKKYDIS